MLVTNPNTNVCSSKEQSHLLSKSKGYHVDQCVQYENTEETSLQQCQANVMNDKKCQVNMQLVKPAVYVTRNVNLPNFTRIQYVIVRTVNLIDVTRKSLQQDQCTMTRTVNLPNLSVK